MQARSERLFIALALAIDIALALAISTGLALGLVNVHNARTELRTERHAERGVEFFCLPLPQAAYRNLSDITAE